MTESGTNIGEPRPWEDPGIVPCDAKRTAIDYGMLLGGELPTFIVNGGLEKTLVMFVDDLPPQSNPIEITRVTHKNDNRG